MLAINQFTHLYMHSIDMLPYHKRFQKYELPNRLRIVLFVEETMPMVATCLAVRVGSKNERPGHTGYAHLIEHLMFRGTPNVPEFDRPLQHAGVLQDARTSEDITVYFATVPRDLLETALFLEADRLRSLPTALTQEKIDAERKIIKSERLQCIDTLPYGVADGTILSNLFPRRHPYSWPILGLPEDIESVSIDEARRFFRRHYSAGNMALCLCGDFDFEEAKSIIAKHFELLPPRAVPMKVTAESVSCVERRIELTGAVQLERVYWSWPTVRNSHPDSTALNLLALVLAGGKASRLHDRLVVNKGIATEVVAKSDTKEIAGLFKLWATVAEGTESPEVEAQFTNELERLHSDPPDETELEGARARYEVAHFLQLSNSQNLAVRMAVDLLQAGDPLKCYGELETFAEIRPSDLQRVVDTYLLQPKVALLIRPDALARRMRQCGPARQGDLRSEVSPDRMSTEPSRGLMQIPPAIRHFNTPKFFHRTASNGVETWAAEWQKTPLVTLVLNIPVGAADDPPGKAGLAMLVSRLLNRPKPRTQGDVIGPFDERGVEISVAAGLDSTSLRLTSHIRNFESALRLLRKLATESQFAVADVEKERCLHLNELVQSPDWVVRRALDALLNGPSHPYGMPPEGTIETVRGLTRDDTIAFYRERFGPKGSQLIAVGPHSAEWLLTRLEDCFGSWESNATAPQSRPCVLTNPDLKILYIIDNPGSAQSILSVSRIWKDRNDTKFVAALLGNNILGGNFLSRLNQSLRVRTGYAYGAGSRIVYRRNGSTWSASAMVRTEITSLAFGEMLSEINAIVDDKPIADEELEIARRANILRLPSTFQSLESLVDSICEVSQFHLSEDYWDSHLQQLQSESPDAVRATMNELVAHPGRLSLVVGDWTRIQFEVSRFGFVDVVVI